MNVIIVSGTPGTGKTTIAKRLAKILTYTYLDVNSLIKKKNISSGYDKKRKCKIIDVKQLNNALIASIKGARKKRMNGLIIDSHLSHFLPGKYVDLCIITTCTLPLLKGRLQKRRYSPAKIRENLDCEIFGICLNEAREHKLPLFIIDTSLSPREIQRLLTGKFSKKPWQNS